MPALSLLLNIVVLIPVCAGLLNNAAWATDAYGPPSPARGILLSVYLAIAIVSALLLWFQEPRAIAALLLVQIVYKTTTPFTVGTAAHPVVATNLGIAAFHTATLAYIWWTLD